MSQVKHDSVNKSINYHLKIDLSFIPITKGKKKTKIIKIHLKLITNKLKPEFQCFPFVWPSALL